MCHNNPQFTNITEPLIRNLILPLHTQKDTQRSIMSKWSQGASEEIDLSLRSDLSLICLASHFCSRDTQLSAVIKAETF